MSIRQQADQLCLEIQEAERILAAKRASLAHIYATCKHQFGDPVYDPIVVKGFTHPGDPPGTMGVDWRAPVYVEGSETPRWRQTCSLCGLTEYTTDTTTVATRHPQFRNRR